MWSSKAEERCRQADLREYLYPWSIDINTTKTAMRPSFNDLVHKSCFDCFISADVVVQGTGQEKDCDGIHIYDSWVEIFHVQIGIHRGFIVLLRSGCSSGGN